MLRSLLRGSVVAAMTAENKLNPVLVRYFLPDTHTPTHTNTHPGSSASQLSCCVQVLSPLVQERGWRGYIGNLLQSPNRERPSNEIYSSSPFDKLLTQQSVKSMAVHYRSLQAHILALDPGHRSSFRISKCFVGFPVFPQLEALGPWGTKLKTSSLISIPVIRNQAYHFFLLV